MSRNGKKISAELDVSALPPLPKGWCWTALATIADIEGGITKDQKRRSTTTTREVPYLRVANVQRGFLDLSDMKSILAEEEKIQSLRLQEGDVLFTEGGDRDKLGRGWVWSGEIPECIHQNHIFRARLCREVAEPKFISYHGNHFGQKWFVRTGKQTTNLASINKGVLSRFPVPLAPLNEQHRIVAKIEELFSDLDAGVAALKRVRANLKRYRAAVLKAAVEGRLTAEWREKNRPNEAGPRLLARILAESRRKWEQDQIAAFAKAGKTPPAKWKDKYKEPPPPDRTNLPPLPEGWCWATVNQAGRVQLGRQRSPKHHTGPHMRPYLRVANVFENRIDTSDVMQMNFTPTEYETYRLGYGDVLLNEGQSKELIGRPAIYRDEVPGACFTNTLVRFRASDGLDPEYALAVFLTYLKNGRFQKIATITVNIAHLGAGRFAKLEFPLPPLAEQRVIVSEVTRHDSIMKAVENEVIAGIKRASSLRQAILQRAFEGELVPQDPADEPAALFLGRIRHATEAASSAKQTPNRDGRHPRQRSRRTSA